MDSQYLGEVGRNTNPPGSAVIGPQYCPGYVMCDNRLKRLAGAIVFMNPQSFVDSSAVKMTKH